MKDFIRILLVLGCLFCSVVVFLGFIYRDRRPRIYFAAERGDTNSIALYLATKSNIDANINCYPFGGTVDQEPLLDIAVRNGRFACVEFLLKKGANPNQFDVRGDTPLMFVIGRTRIEVPPETRLQMLDLLISAGADPNLISTSGYSTPLIHAADLGQSEIVRRLLRAGAVIQATNREGLTALHFAANAETAKLLLSAGADRESRIGGETPAETAARLGHFGALNVITNYHD
jgi:ankyrin repeat protein